MTRITSRTKSSEHVGLAALKRKLLIGSLASLCVAPVALAAEPNVRVYTVEPRQHQSVQIVTRRVVEPAATVSRALSEQPVRPHMVELRIADRTTFFDPQAEHLQPRRFRIDENHTIIRAQRLANSLNARPVTVIYGSDAAAERNLEPQPHIILLKPDYLRPAPRPRSLPPVVPQQVKEPLRQVAQAD